MPRLSNVRTRKKNEEYKAKLVDISKLCQEEETTLKLKSTELIKTLFQSLDKAQSTTALATKPHSKEEIETTEHQHFPLSAENRLFLIEQPYLDSKQVECPKYTNKKHQKEISSKKFGKKSHTESNTTKLYTFPEEHSQQYDFTTPFVQDTYHQLSMHNHYFPNPLEVNSQEKSLQKEPRNDYNSISADEYQEYQMYYFRVKSNIKSLLYAAQQAQTFCVHEELLTFERTSTQTDATKRLSWILSQISHWVLRKKKFLKSSGQLSLSDSHNASDVISYSNRAPSLSNSSASEFFSEENESRRGSDGERDQESTASKKGGSWDGADVIDTNEMDSFLEQAEFHQKKLLNTLEVIEKPLARRIKKILRQREEERRIEELRREKILSGEIEKLLFSQISSSTVNKIRNLAKQFGDSKKKIPTGGSASTFDPSMITNFMKGNGKSFQESTVQGVRQFYDALNVAKSRLVEIDRSMSSIESQVFRYVEQFASVSYAKCIEWMIANGERARTIKGSRVITASMPPKEKYFLYKDMVGYLEKDITRLNSERGKLLAFHNMCERVWYKLAEKDNNGRVLIERREMRGNIKERMHTMSLAYKSELGLRCLVLEDSMAVIYDKNITPAVESYMKNNIVDIKREIQQRVRSSLCLLKTSEIENNEPNDALFEAPEAFFSATSSGPNSKDSLENLKQRQYQAKLGEIRKTNHNMALNTFLQQVKDCIFSMPLLDENDIPLRNKPWIRSLKEDNEIFKTFLKERHETITAEHMLTVLAFFVHSHNNIFTASNYIRTATINNNESLLRLLSPILSTIEHCHLEFMNLFLIQISLNIRFEKMSLEASKDISLHIASELVCNAKFESNLWKEKLASYVTKATDIILSGRHAHYDEIKRYDYYRNIYLPSCFEHLLQVLYPSFISILHISNEFIETLDGLLSTHQRVVESDIKSSPSKKMKPTVDTINSIHLSLKVIECWRKGMEVIRHRHVADDWHSAFIAFLASHPTKKKKSVRELLYNYSSEMHPTCAATLEDHSYPSLSKFLNKRLRKSTQQKRYLLTCLTAKQSALSQLLGVIERRISSDSKTSDEMFQDFIKNYKISYFKSGITALPPFITSTLRLLLYTGLSCNYGSIVSESDAYSYTMGESGFIASQQLIPILDKDFQLLKESNLIPKASNSTLEQTSNAKNRIQAFLKDFIFNNREMNGTTYLNSLKNDYHSGMLREYIYLSLQCLYWQVLLHSSYSHNREDVCKLLSVVLTFGKILVDHHMSSEFGSQGSGKYDINTVYNELCLFEHSNEVTMTTTMAYRERMNYFQSIIEKSLILTEEPNNLKPASASRNIMTSLFQATVLALKMDPFASNASLLKENHIDEEGSGDRKPLSEESEEHNMCSKVIYDLEEANESKSREKYFSSQAINEKEFYEKALEKYFKLENMKTCTTDYEMRNRYLSPFFYLDSLLQSSDIHHTAHFSTPMNRRNLLFERTLGMPVYEEISNTYHPLLFDFNIWNTYRRENEDKLFTNIGACTTYYSTVTVELNNSAAQKILTPLDSVILLKLKSKLREIVSVSDAATKKHFNSVYEVILKNNDVSLHHLYTNIAVNACVFGCFFQNNLYQWSPSHVDQLLAADSPQETVISNINTNRSIAGMNILLATHKLDQHQDLSLESVLPLLFSSYGIAVDAYSISSPKGAKLPKDFIHIAKYLLDSFSASWKVFRNTIDKAIEEESMLLACNATWFHSAIQHISKHNTIAIETLRKIKQLENNDNGDSGVNIIITNPFEDYHYALSKMFPSIRNLIDISQYSNKSQSPASSNALPPSPYFPVSVSPNNTSSSLNSHMLSQAEENPPLPKTRTTLKIQEKSKKPTTVDVKRKAMNESSTKNDLDVSSKKLSLVEWSEEGGKLSRLFEYYVFFKGNKELERKKKLFLSFIVLVLIISDIPNNDIEKEYNIGITSNYIKRNAANWDLLDKLLFMYQTKDKLMGTLDNISKIIFYADNDILKVQQILKKNTSEWETLLMHHGIDLSSRKHTLITISASLIGVRTSLKGASNDKGNETSEEIEDTEQVDYLYDNEEGVHGYLQEELLINVLLQMTHYYETKAGEAGNSTTYLCRHTYGEKTIFSCRIVEEMYNVMEYIFHLTFDRQHDSSGFSIQLPHIDIIHQDANDLSIVHHRLVEPYDTKRLLDIFDLSNSMLIALLEMIHLVSPELYHVVVNYPLIHLNKHNLILSCSENIYETPMRILYPFLFFGKASEKSAQDGNTEEFLHWYYNLHTTYGNPENSYQFCSFFSRCLKNENVSSNTKEQKYGLDYQERIQQHWINKKETIVSQLEERRKLLVDFCRTERAFPSSIEAIILWWNRVQSKRAFQGIDFSTIYSDLFPFNVVSSKQYQTYTLSASSSVRAEGKDSSRKSRKAGNNELQSLMIPAEEQHNNFDINIPPSQIIASTYFTNLKVPFDYLYLLTCLNNKDPSESPHGYALPGSVEDMLARYATRGVDLNQLETKRTKENEFLDYEENDWCDSKKFPSQKDSSQAGDGSTSARRQGELKSPSAIRSARTMKGEAFADDEERKNGNLEIGNGSGKISKEMSINKKKRIQFASKNKIVPISTPGPMPLVSNSIPITPLSGGRGERDKTLLHIGNESERNSETEELVPENTIVQIISPTSISKEELRNITSSKGWKIRTMVESHEDEESLNNSIGSLDGVDFESTEGNNTLNMLQYYTRQLAPTSSPSSSDDEEEVAETLAVAPNLLNRKNMDGSTESKQRMELTFLSDTARRKMIHKLKKQLQLDPVELSDDSLESTIIFLEKELKKQPPSSPVEPSHTPRKKKKTLLFDETTIEKRSQEEKDAEILDGFDITRKDLRLLMKARMKMMSMEEKKQQRIEKAIGEICDHFNFYPIKKAGLVYSLLQKRYKLRFANSGIFLEMTESDTHDQVRPDLVHDVMLRQFMLYQSCLGYKKISNFLTVDAVKEYFYHYYWSLQKTRMDIQVREYEEMVQEYQRRHRERKRRKSASSIGMSDIDARPGYTSVNALLRKIYLDHSEVGTSHNQLEEFISSSLSNMNSAFLNASSEQGLTRKDFSPELEGKRGAVGLNEGVQQKRLRTKDTEIQSSPENHHMRLMRERLGDINFNFNGNEVGGAKPKQRTLFQLPQETKAVIPFAFSNGRKHSIALPNAVVEKAPLPQRRMSVVQLIQEKNKLRSKGKPSFNMECHALVKEILLSAEERNAGKFQNNIVSVKETQQKWKIFIQKEKQHITSLIQQFNDLELIEDLISASKQNWIHQYNQMSIPSILKQNKF